MPNIADYQKEQHAEFKRAVQAGGPGSGRYPAGSGGTGHRGPSDPANPFVRAGGPGGLGPGETVKSVGIVSIPTANSGTTSFTRMSASDLKSLRQSYSKIADGTSPLSARARQAMQDIDNELAMRVSNPR